MSQTIGMKRVRGALKPARERAGGGKVRVVMGNEAADLDSMASALMYAWYLSETDDSLPTLPFIPIPRDDFKLRTEALYLFEAVGMPVAELLFQEDIDLSALGAKGGLRLALVDHNKLGKAVAEFGDAVVAILDHHQDEKLYPNAGERVIESVGSCATLVAEKILRDIPGKLEADAAELLLGTILLDTVGLDEAAGRVTPKDLAVAGELASRCGADVKKLFERLQFEKFNVAALDTADLLRKDYKEYKAESVSYGMSSVLLSTADWVKKDADLVGALDSYAEKRGLDILVVMNAYTKADFRRELGLYARDPELLRKTIAFLRSQDLDLAPLPETAPPASERTAFFAQGNGSYSRKKLQPLLQDFLSGITG